MSGGLLINTHRLSDVQVDPLTATARIEAGASSGAVMTAAARSGLAPLVGAAPAVGFVAYTLGGGLGLLGRAYGYSADSIRRLEVVTADGRELVVSPDQHPELFWASGGGGGNLAAVTALEVALLPVVELWGGGLYFPGERAAQVLECFTRCVAEAPDELTLSIAFLTFPDALPLPAPLRGRFCCHVRIAYAGPADAGHRLIAPLRQLSPFLDTVRMMPLTDIGTIHADPTSPAPVNNNSIALRDDDLSDDVLTEVLPFLEPGAPYMLEIRHLGGALRGQPGIDNAVGHRTARFNVFTTAFPGADPVAAAAAQQRVHDTVSPASVGGPLRNFLPAGRDASPCYEPDIASRLSDLKTVWDPDRRFATTPRINRS